MEFGKEQRPTPVPLRRVACPGGAGGVMEIGEGRRPTPVPLRRVACPGGGTFGPSFRPRFWGGAKRKSATQASGVPRGRGRSDGVWEGATYGPSFRPRFWGGAKRKSATQASGVPRGSEESFWTELSIEVLGWSEAQKCHSGEWRAQEGELLDRAFDRGFLGGEGDGGCNDGIMGRRIG